LALDKRDARRAFAEAKTSILDRRAKSGGNAQERPQKSLSFHPMYRFMGQGAAQPIEDLAACLVAAGDADPAETLRNYERLRLPRLTLVQAMS
jgi:hypothetical protein